MNLCKKNTPKLYTIDLISTAEKTDFTVKSIYTKYNLFTEKKKQIIIVTWYLQLLDT